jgi:hypothetical protein
MGGGELLVTENAVLFGPGKTLVGVVSEPPPGARRAKVACIFLNAGFTHHVGPQRIYVHVARRLAAAGVTALRFDHSGIGDSAGRQDSMAFEDSTVLEAQEAMTFLESTRGVREFVLIGICWGADNALRACRHDHRVVGVAAVDFYALPSVRNLVRSHRARLVDPRSWLALLCGRSPALGRIVHGVLDAARRKLSRAEVITSEGLMPVLSPAAIAAQLGEVVDRGVKLCMVYAQGAPAYDQYCMHFRGPMRVLEAAGGLRLVLYPQADHVFTLLRNHAALVDDLVRWAVELADERARAGAPAAIVGA